MLRTALFFCSLILATSAPAATVATYDITLSENGAKAFSRTANVDVQGKPLAIEWKQPFALQGGCLTEDSGTIQLDGNGRSGQTVTVKTVQAGGDVVEVVVTIANRTFVRPIDVSAEACSAQTPAMLSWDASAKFTLRQGEAKSFRAGSYTATLRLVDVKYADNGQAVVDGVAL